MDFKKNWLESIDSWQELYLSADQSNYKKGKFKKRKLNIHRGIIDAYIDWRNLTVLWLQDNIFLNWILWMEVRDLWDKN